MAKLEDRKERYLLNHSESDSLFEVFTEAERNQMCDSPNYCDDVTDIPYWEAEFKRQKGIQ